MKCVAVTTTHPRSALIAAGVIVESLEELSRGNFIGGKAQCLLISCS